MCTVYIVQLDLCSRMECTCVLCTVYNITCVLGGSVHALHIVYDTVYDSGTALCTVYSMCYVLGWSAHVYSVQCAT